MKKSSFLTVCEMTKSLRTLRNLFLRQNITIGYSKFSTSWDLLIARIHRFQKCFCKFLMYQFSQAYKLSLPNVHRNRRFYVGFYCFMHVYIVLRFAHIDVDTNNTILALKRRKEKVEIVIVSKCSFPDKKNLQILKYWSVTPEK